MKTMVPTAAAWWCVIAALLSAATAEELQWLQYGSARDAHRIVGDMRSQKVELSDTKPKGVELPEFKGHRPLFGRWSTPMVKAGHLWIALDRTHKYGLYDRLFIDSDADGHLRDETAVEPYRTERNEAHFGPVALVLEGEDGPITYHLNFESECDENRAELAVSSGGWYEGTVTVGQEKKHCVLIDYNANGAFDDKSLDPDDCDRIRVGKKGDRDSQFVGNYVQVDGLLYRLETARDGAYVKLTKAEDVKFGNIRLPEATVELTAGGENGLFTLKPERGIAQLPIGKYRIGRWAIEREDEEDHRWKLEGRWFDSRGNFEVSEESETTLTIGEPVNSILNARRRDSEYSFRQYLGGQLGEYVQLTRDGTRPQAPKLHIKSADGKYDRTFAFEYG
jgi:hypothetical protein